MNEGAAWETLTPGSEATVDQAALSTSPSEDMIRVLYADDEESLRKIVRIYLEIIDTSLVIESVSLATDALKALEKHDYDNVVSDYQMPGMNGNDFAQTVKESTTSPSSYTQAGGARRSTFSVEIGINMPVIYEKRGSSLPLHHHVSSYTEEDDQPCCPDNHVVVSRRLLRF